MNADHPQHEDEISLIDLWTKAKEWCAYLWKRKGWILTIALLFAVGGFIKVKWAKPSYLAKLTFSLEQGGGNSSSLSSLASQFGYSIGSDGGGMFSGENLLALMKSRRMIEDVLLTPIVVEGDSILLIDQYVKSWPKLKESWDSTGLYPYDTLLKRAPKQDSALGVIYYTIIEKSLVVTKKDKDLSFVSVSYTGHDESFTKAFVEQLAAQATDFYIANKTNHNRKNLAKLQRRVDSVTTELESAMLSASRANDANLFTVQSAAKVSSIEKQMKVTLLSTLYGELVKNLEVSKTMAAREEPLITVIDRPHYPLRVRKSGLKGAMLGGALGGFLTVLFYVGRAFLDDLNQRVAAQKQGA